MQQRLGPYRGFNPVSRTQIWQWCSAIGEGSPLYLDAAYQANTEFAGKGAVAPPAMMQMWTMRDINDDYAPGSTDAHPYPLMAALEQAGFPDNVAVGYDLHFHRYLTEGDEVHHYKSVAKVSDLKRTQLGEGHFFTDRMEYLDQHGELFAEAFITYFQYRANAQAEQSQGTGSERASTADEETPTSAWQSDYSDRTAADLSAGMELPELTVPITHRLIVGGAIATQDFIPVHHDLPAAQAAGMPDIFMNILTSCGLSARYLSDWAGPASRLKQLSFKLMTPNHPGDRMVFGGRIDELNANESGTEVALSFSGSNARGPHVMGSAIMKLPVAD